MSRIVRKPLVTLTLGALTAMALVGVAVGAIPGGDGTVHGCYQKPGLLKNPGAVRVIDAEAGQSCRNDENAFTWDRTDRVHQARVAADGTLLGGDAISAHLTRDAPAPGVLAPYTVKFGSDLTSDCVATATPVLTTPSETDAVFATQVNAGSDSVGLRVAEDGPEADGERAFQLIVAC